MITIFQFLADYLSGNDFNPTSCVGGSESAFTNSSIQHHIKKFVCRVIKHAC